jgi:hypothetical protein
VPEFQPAHKKEANESKHRKAAEKLNGREQPQSVVAVDNHPSRSTEQEARRRLAETENTECPSRAGDFVSEPIKRYFAHELTDRRDQIAGPEERIILMPKRLKDANETAPSKEDSQLAEPIFKSSA